MNLRPMYLDLDFYIPNHHYLHFAKSEMYDVGLEEGLLTELSLCSYQQLLQVSGQDRVLILLLVSLSSERLDQYLRSSWQCCLLN